MKTQNQELKKDIAYLLKGNYSCGRVWSAWQVGTMHQEDFAPLEENDELVDDFVKLFSVYGKRVREEEGKKNTRKLINQFGEAIENFIGRDMACQIVSEVKSNLSPTQKKGNK